MLGLHSSEGMNLIVGKALQDHSFISNNKIQKRLVHIIIKFQREVNDPLLETPKLSPT